MAQISFAILVTYLQTILICTEITTIKYPLIYYILAEAIVVAAAAASVLAISKRVGAMAERVTLRPYILLQMGVLIGEEVSVGGENMVVQAGIVRV